MPIKKNFITSDLFLWRCHNLQIEFGTMDFTHLYALCRWNFLSSLLQKCWCHFWTMLDMQLHSCSNLEHVHGYNSDNGSFRDCVVSHCVQMCLSYFFSFFRFLLFLCFFFFVALVAIRIYKVAVITMMAYLLLIKWDEFSATLVNFWPFEWLNFHHFSKKLRKNGWLNFQPLFALPIEWLIYGIHCQHIVLIVIS